MKLTDRHAGILKTALNFDKYTPRDGTMFAACLELMEAGLLEWVDTVPSYYKLTEAGERVAEDVKTAPKSARFYVYTYVHA